MVKMWRATFKVWMCNGQQTLAVREMQMRCHRSNVRTAIVWNEKRVNAGEVIRKKTPQYTAGGNVN